MQSLVYCKYTLILPATFLPIKEMTKRQFFVYEINFFTVASDCMDERFIPYNGSCFLFVFYPEVDWLTAQNACRGIGTQLASIASKEEENFIVNAMRNSLDFSPQALYWVGGELAENGRFEWVDGSEMKLKVSV